MVGMQPAIDELSTYLYTNSDKAVSFLCLCYTHVHADVIMCIYCLLSNAMQCRSIHYQC